MPMVSPPAAGVITDTTSPAPAGGGVAVATSWFEQLRNSVAQMIGGAAETTLTIASGTVTPTQAVHAIETEGAAAADDLSLIGQGSGVPSGWEVRIRCADQTHVVTVKHNTGGTGTIFLADGADLVLNDTSMWLDLQRRGSAWYEVRRSYGGNKTGLTAFLNAATAAIKGIVELATGSETITGTDATRAVTPDSLADLWEDGGDLSNGATITFPGGGVFRLITSTTAITAFAFTTSKVGRRVLCKLATDRTITANSNIEIVPGGASISGKAGDVFEVEDRGSGNARVNWYSRADGRAVVSPSNVVRDYIAGLTMSNNTGTPNTKIDVAAGQAADSTNADMIDFAGGTLDLTTTGANGLRTGSLAVNTNYALFVIKGTSGVALFADTALTPGTRPSGYTAAWRRIGVFRAIDVGAGVAGVIPFIQTGRKFRRTTLVEDVVVSQSTSSVNHTISLPSGKKWPVTILATGITGVAARVSGYFRDPDSADQAPSVIFGRAQFTTETAIASLPYSAEVSLVTNASAQIAARYDNTADLHLNLLYWEDDAL